jgi:hypothetical protein
MRRRIAAAVLVAFIAGAFGTVSLLVILTKRNPWFIERKLQLGALLLTLTACATGCRGGGPGPFVTCYDVAPSNSITIDQLDYQASKILLNASEPDTITGTLSFREGTAFSFALRDSSKTILRKENLLPADGAFDADQEQFSIAFSQLLPVGVYSLEFFSRPADSIKDSTVADLNSFIMQVAPAPVQK